MDFTQFIDFVTDPKAIITGFGLLGVFIIIFLETGFFFGLLFPGDSLLFTAGLFAAQGYFSVGWLFLGVFIAAVAGDTMGYAFGKKVGPSLFVREDSRFFKKKYVIKAQHFYEIYGPRTIIMARFVPFVRTFAPIVAGIAEMKYKTFLIFNVVGGFLWTLLIVGLGYGFGRVIPDPDRFLLPAILIIIVVSALPGLREIFRKHP